MRENQAPSSSYLDVQQASDGQHISSNHQTNLLVNRLIMYMSGKIVSFAGKTSTLLSKIPLLSVPVHLRGICHKALQVV